MNLENLKFIENRYNFKYPKIYQTLLTDNMLDWGEFGKDWFKNEYPRLKDNPPLLLYGDDFEILPFEMILEEIESFSDEDDYRQTKKEFYNKFIPFGQTGGGDLYCFFLDKENNINSIVLVWHDCNEVEIIANNLENFIFRQLLECVIDPYEDGYEFRENIKRQLVTHKKYLNKQQLSIIEKIYSRKNQILLDNKEFMDILKSMNFNISDNIFEYQVE